jgi:hypothetical protein
MIQTPLIALEASAHSFHLPPHVDQRLSRSNRSCLVSGGNCRPFGKLTHYPETVVRYRIDTRCASSAASTPAWVTAAR